MQIDESKMLDEIRKLVECPVCYELPEKIYLCGLGHNICETCVHRMARCPICQHGFSKIRNFFAESVVTMLGAVPTTVAFEPLLSIGNSVNHAWGIFPCWINHNCEFEGRYLDILQHLQTKHPNDIQMITDSKIPVTNIRDIFYNVRGSWNRVYHIADRGLFVLQIDIDCWGNLRAGILMYGSVSMAKKYYYEMHIENNGKRWYHTSKVYTCRTPLDVLDERNLYISRRKIIYNSDPGEVILLTCLFTIKEKKNVSEGYDY